MSAAWYWLGLRRASQVSLDYSREEKVNHDDVLHICKTRAKLLQKLVTELICRLQQQNINTNWHRWRNTIKGDSLRTDNLCLYLWQRKRPRTFSWLLTSPYSNKVTCSTAGCILCPPLIIAEVRHGATCWPSPELTTSLGMSSVPRKLCRSLRLMSLWKERERENNADIWMNELITNYYKTAS